MEQPAAQQHQKEPVFQFSFSTMEVNEVIAAVRDRLMSKSLDQTLEAWTQIQGQLAVQQFARQQQAQPQGSGLPPPGKKA